jgi:hypothetical protein
LPQPGKSTADGQHWVYRYDGHRKCWFQAAEGTATAKKPIHHAAGHRVAAPKENESPLRNRKAVVDAPGSAPTEAPQPTPLAPEMKVVDAVAGGAALVPPALVAAQPATDQLTPDPPKPLQVDVETFMAAPSASDAVGASVPPVTPVAVPSTEVGVDGGGGTATWLGMLLIALGLVSLLSSSRILREGRAGQDISPSEAGVGGHRRTPASSFAFGPNTVNRPTANENLFRPQSARPAI